MRPAVNAAASGASMYTQKGPQTKALLAARAPPSARCGFRQPVEMGPAARTPAPSAKEMAMNPAAWLCTDDLVCRTTRTSSSVAENSAPNAWPTVASAATRGAALSAAVGARARAARLARMPPTNCRVHIATALERRSWLVVRRARVTAGLKREVERRPSDAIRAPLTSVAAIAVVVKEAKGWAVTRMKNVYKVLPSSSTVTVELSMTLAWTLVGVVKEDES
mmetsp:Transcript_12400/g.39226  ORF Transcript_12400/g.39226 Transcript_12400/m.39226 type:complete len:222 (+) Transcript_12400:197-862(+)